MLNVIWVSFFVLGFIAALVQSLYFGVSGMWSNIVGDIFTSAKTAFSQDFRAAFLQTYARSAQRASGNGFNDHEYGSQCFGAG